MHYTLYISLKLDFSFYAGFAGNVDKVTGVTTIDQLLGDMMFRILFLSIIAVGLLSASISTFNYWHAAYFDVEYNQCYGRSGEEERYIQDLITRSYMVMQLDSVLRYLRKNNQLEHFTHWTLIDSYMKSYNYVGGRPIFRKLFIENKRAYLCLTDSVSLNYALKKLWNITNDEIVICPGKKSGMWLYSLHFGYSKDRLWARRLNDTLVNFMRPDTAQLWLWCESDWMQIHSWYQHETDGYYHQYTGLYLTTQSAAEAQKLLLERCGIKTTIVSHYITPAILRAYIKAGF